MGAIKQFLEEAIHELAGILGIDEKLLYLNDDWYKVALHYAQNKLNSKLYR